MIPSRDQIERVNDTKVSEPIPVPEWGEGWVVHVRSISGDEHAEWQELVNAQRGKDKRVNPKGLKAALLVRTVCDDKGNRLFNSEDASWLGGKSSAVINRLWDRTCELNGMGDDAQKKLEKNSEPTPTSASGSS